MTKRTLGVYITRAQPLTIAHEYNIQCGVKQFTEVLVFIGSAGRPNTTRNPFSDEQRQTMIRTAFIATAVPYIYCLSDYTYRPELWIQEVRSTVDRVCSMYSIDEDEIYLMGFNKDNSSYYLNMFPDYKSFDINPFYMSGSYLVNATDVRKLMFEGDLTWRDYIPHSIINNLNLMMNEVSFQDLRLEYRFEEAYKKEWKGSTYDPHFITTDAVVVCSGHILLIERGQYPGKGQIALPGGYLQTDLTLVENMVKELREESRLKLPERFLSRDVNAQISQHVFDDPHRSSLGRTVTHAFYIHLKPGTLPEVRGEDDAKRAFWLSLSKLDSSVMFQDHYDIIRYFTG